MIFGSSNKDSVDKKNQRTHQKDEGFSEFSEFADKQPVAYGQILLWISSVLAVVMAGYFWFSNDAIDQKITDKQNEGSKIVADISSSQYSEIEEQADGLKDSLSILKKVYKNRVITAKFMSDLYSRIDTDVQVTNISISDDKTISITGKTKTYRTAADQIVALENWNNLENVKLGTVSQDLNANGVSSGIVFSATATMKTNTTDSLSQQEGSANETF